MAEIATGPPRLTGPVWTFAAEDGSLGDLQKVALVKNGHHFVFRYAEGEEETVIQVLMEMAGRTDLAFDWFDAAVLSRQVNEKLLRRLDT